MASFEFSGQAMRCSALSGYPGFSEVVLDLKGDSVNKFNALTLKELREVVTGLQADSGLKGVLLTSAKDVFVVGADVTEFLEGFKKPESELFGWLNQCHGIFNGLEDLSCPTVVALNGFALGGGCEVSLACTYRVMSSTAKFGLPETKLGIYPGWGGTIRLSRLAGADTAIEWIAGGEQYDAATALKAGAVDGVTAPEALRDAAIRMLLDAASGKLDWKKRVAEKKAPLKLNKVESTMVFEGAKAFVSAKAGPHYPAPLAAIEAMQKGATKSRDEAIPSEAEGFVKMAKTPQAAALVGVFLGDQGLKKIAKKFAKDAKPVETAAVLGAGIMGGGIAYTSASKGVPAYMKDIHTKQIDLGLAEAAKIMGKQVERGKMTPDKMAATMARIRPTLSYGDFGHVDFVVEAVVEREDVKKSVLAEVEKSAKPGAIIASNTSTISISRLAEGLKNPENFVGMHFFNPVHRMPLVEVIRGKKSSETAVATAVAYAQKMGKSVIVVNDCAGFFVNRVLFPYFAGFQGLIADGVDFVRMDKVMERFGWPMGPAYLLDVVGIDTAVHADKVMADAFPDRMRHAGRTAIEAMVEAKRYGQKNGKGFYQYVPDKKGPPKKEMDPSVADLLKPVVKGSADVTDDDIIYRMMLPMIIESARCIEDGIIGSAMEVDMGLLYGLGFPPFRGGAMRYADQVGLSKICQVAEKYAKLGKLYEPTARMREMASTGKGFYN